MDPVDGVQRLPGRDRMPSEYICGRASASARQVRLHGRQPQRPHGDSHGPGWGGDVRVPAAALTVDTIRRMAACNESMAVSTAALLSARWPYISPSGLLPCKDPRVSVVDGGYTDGNGTQGVLELWQQLEPLVARYNASQTSRRVVPVLAVIDNHYRSESAPPHYGNVGELLVPPTAVSTGKSTRDVDRWQQGDGRAGRHPRFGGQQTGMLH